MSSSVDPVRLRRTCAKFATGITIAAVIGEDGLPHGMTVNSFTSVSAMPPLVLICVDHASKVLAHFRASSHYGISVLAEDQQDLSNRFAQKGQDRFNGISWLAGETGVPLIPGALAHFECAMRNVVEAGDHTVFIGEVVTAGTREEGRPLLYYDGGYRRLD